MKNPLRFAGAWRLSALAVILAGLAACSNDVAAPLRTATSISISPPGATLDAIGATQNFQAVVRDQNGQAMDDAEILWSVPGNSVVSLSTGGLATAQGNGSTQVTAASGTLQASVAVSVQQLPHSILVVGGNNQSGVVATTLPSALQVRVRDRLGVAIPGAQVQFEVSTGGGSVNSGNSSADASGDVSAQWTLGTVASTSHTVTARSTTVASASTTFNGTALAGAPTALQKVSGDAQNGVVGSSVAAAPVVRLVDAFGNPIANAAVTFTVVGGSGAVSGSPATTSIQGLAAPTSWLLGNVPGVNTLRASSASVPAVDFSAQANAGPPSVMLLHQGAAQNANIGTAVAVAPAVRVTDAFGNGIASVQVTFVVTGGGGAVTGATVSTNSDGIAAAASWTLGTTPGANQLTATAAAGGLPPVIFAATGTVSPANVVVYAGNNQIAPAGTAVAVAPAVRVTTAQGLPAPGIAVAFTVSGGGGITSGAIALTDANGVAVSSGWTLGISAGANAMSASVAGLSLVQFVATGVPGPAANLTIIAGNNQSAATSTAVAIDPAARVTDQFGNGVPGSTVTFAVAAGGGSLSGGVQISNQDGNATLTSWTLGATPGLNRLTASVAGLTTVTFDATATIQPAAMVIHAGNLQQATVASMVAIAPAVRVTDAGSSPVQGVTVTFAVTAGGGSLQGSVAVTDANGVAAVTSWTLGTAAGVNTMQATADGLGPVTFSASGTAGAAASIALNGGNNQTAAPGAVLPVAPSVIVRDAHSNPVSGVSVTFAVTGGGGSAGGAAQVTSAAGVATVGSWTIQSGANSLTATATGAGISGNPVVFSATGSSSAFSISLRYLTAITPSQQAIFEAAIVRWQQIITGDVPDIPVNLPANDCASGSPAMNEVVDDLVIYVSLEPIDGVGSVLGSAGPCRVRSSTWIPVTGRMRFDVADIASMEASGSLQDVILHEMGHVLGIGTIWSVKGFRQNPSLPSSPGVDTHFSGLSAIAAFNSIGGNTYANAKVPVENSQGGSGTRDAHWREGVFSNELMTGFINNGANPLSVVTIQSLQDLGYVVNAGAATPYSLPGSGSLLLDLLPKLHLMGDILDVPIRPIGG